MAARLVRAAFQPALASLQTATGKLFSPKWLLVTNTTVTVGLSITGDVMQQCYQAKRKQKTVPWDRVRTERMAMSGLVIAPFVHYWYIYLDRWFPGRTFRVLCGKVILDQLVCSPVYLTLFLLSLGLMEDRSWTQIKKDFLDKGYVLYIAEWVVWPPAQFFNFYCLPTKYRVLYDNTISLTFDVFWSYVWYDMETDSEDKSSQSTELAEK